MSTTTTHPNVDLVRQLMEAFNSMDVPTIDGLMADDIVWHQIGGPTVEGKDALRETMSGSGMMTEGDDRITTEVHDIVANDDHAIVLVNAHATLRGRSLDYRTAEILHVRDGKITERWAFSDDTARIAEFFSG